MPRQREKWLNTIHNILTNEEPGSQRGPLCRFYVIRIKTFQVRRSDELVRP
jgi:hypothetical protein